MSKDIFNFPETEWSKLAAPYCQEALKTYQEYIAIPSYNDPASVTADKPFGQYVAKALDFVAKLGQSLGFKVDRCDNYCTELSYGEGPLVDIYAHSDTVPVEKKNWKTDPFKPTIEGDKIFGRGAVDDKGPGLACLYGVKALLDHKLIDGYKVRVIFGGNEELGCACLLYYFHNLKKDYPTFGISPDADYPLIYAEKAICNYDAEFAVDLGSQPFAWGTAINLVCNDVSFDFANLPGDLPADKIKKTVDGYLARHKEVTEQWDGSRLRLKGKGYHGSMPWNGVNSGLHMLNLLAKLTDEQKLHEAYEDYKDGRGQLFGGDYKSEAFAEGSSYCAGLFTYTPGKLVIRVNMRIPENQSFATAVGNVETNTKADKITVQSKTPALYVDPESPLIKTLMKVYREETGDKASKPLAIGGGTYAKESQNSVAFGGCLPGRDFGMHEDNEWFYLPDFYLNIGIYAHAIYAMGQLAKESQK